MSQEPRRGQKIPPSAELGPQPREEVVQVRNEEAADLQRDARGTPAGEEGHENHAVRHELRGDSEEPDHGFLAALVLMRRVAEGDEECREECEIGPIDEWRVAPGDLVESLPRLALSSPQSSVRHERKGEKG